MLRVISAMLCEISEKWVTGEISSKVNSSALTLS